MDIIGWLIITFSKNCLFYKQWHLYATFNIMIRIRIGEETWWWMLEMAFRKIDETTLNCSIRPRMNMSRMHFGICDACYSIGKSQHLLAGTPGQRRLTDSRYNTKIFQAHLRRMTLSAGRGKGINRSCIICKFCEILREDVKSCKKFHRLHFRNK